MRKVLFWMHLATGVAAGAIVFLMSVTGVLLMYERQIVAFADRGLRSLPPDGSRRLPASEILARAGAVEGKEPPSAITLRSDPAAPASVRLGREVTLFVNPYSGEVLGEGNARVRRFFRCVTDWHRYIGRSGEWRPTGKAITGAANLAFLFLVLSGPFLWWPRSWKWSSIRSVLLFRRGLSGRPRDFNWHNVIGAWSTIPLFVMVFGGVVISYPWASDLLYRVTGSEPPARRADAARPSGGEAPRPPTFDGIDAAIAAAAERVPDWQSITVRLSSSDAPWSLQIDRGSGARPDLRAQLTVYRATGAEVRFEPYVGQPPAQKIRGWLRFLHTGEALGIGGQTVAGLASGGAAVLVFTGLRLTFRRFFGR